MVSTLSLPASSGSAGSWAPPLLILGCFSELMTPSTSTLLPRKNSVNCKIPGTLDIWRVITGAVFQVKAKLDFQTCLIPGLAGKRASPLPSRNAFSFVFFPCLVLPPLPSLFPPLSFVSSAANTHACFVNSHHFRQKERKASSAFQKKPRSFPMTMS